MRIASLALFTVFVCSGVRLAEAGKPAAQRELGPREQAAARRDHQRGERRAAAKRNKEAKDLRRYGAPATRSSYGGQKSITVARPDGVTTSRTERRYQTGSKRNGTTTVQINKQTSAGVNRPLATSMSKTTQTTRTKGRSVTASQKQQTSWIGRQQSWRRSSGQTATDLDHRTTVTQRASQSTP